MDSQGRSLSKGFPEEETGASHMSENSSGRQEFFFRRLEAFASDIFSCLWSSGRLFWMRHKLVLLLST